MNNNYLDCFHLGKIVGLYRITTQLVESLMYRFMNHVQTPKCDVIHM